MIIVSRLSKKFAATCLTAIAAVVILICGVSNVLARDPDSFVEEIITVIQNSSDEAPILAGDIWIFLGSNIYSTDTVPVFGTLDMTFTNGWGSEEPMKYYADHLARLDSGVYPTVQTFLSENQEFWYVIENSDELPVGDFFITDSIKTDHFTALKLQVLN